MMPLRRRAALLCTAGVALQLLACEATAHATNTTDSSDENGDFTLADFLPDSLRSMTSHQDSSAEPPCTVDALCLLTKCPLAMAKAMISPTFWKLASCEINCKKFWDDVELDPTPEKYQYQNCTTICARTYEGDGGDAMLACGMEKDCIKFGKLNVTCPTAQLEAAVEPNSSLDNLQGEWWQQYGKNLIYDCYPCQHIHGNFLKRDEEFCSRTVIPEGSRIEPGPLKAPCYSYTYSYDVFVEEPGQADEDGNPKIGLQRLNQTWQLPGPTQHKAGAPIDIYYQYLGTMHNETWYILKSTDRYVALGYCSFMNGWTNVGGILWTKAAPKGSSVETAESRLQTPEAVTLTPAEMGEIRDSYKSKLGWNFPGEFCSVRHGESQQCDDLPAAKKMIMGDSQGNPFGKPDALIYA